MTNIVMIAKGRPRLTTQALNSIYEKEHDAYSLVIVDDGSSAPWNPFTPDSLEVQLPRFTMSYRAIFLRLSRSKGIVGLARNIGASVSEQYWGRGDFLCFLDNDVAITNPHWLELLACSLELNQKVKILGGCQHPYHGTNQSLDAYGASVHVTDAVAGYSLFMRWETWDKYGPFPANQPGIGASEDFALCRRVVDDGGLVGYINPPVLAHCGITNTDGKPATGADQFKRVEGLLYE